MEAIPKCGHDALHKNHISKKNVGSISIVISADVLSSVAGNHL